MQRRFSTKLGNGPSTALPWSHGGQHDASNPQCGPARIGLKRARDDTQDAPAEDNGSEDTSLAAVTQSGSDPGGRACTFMHRFLLHHLFSIMAWSMVLGPISQGGLDPVTKNRALGMVNPTCPRSDCLHLMHRVRTPPLRNLPRGALGRVGSRWLDGVVSVRRQDRCPLYRTSGRLQRLGTRRLGVTSGRARSLRISRLIAVVFVLGLTPSTRAHQGPLVSTWKSFHQSQLALPARVRGQ